jgi:hypothetical protein
MGEGGAETAGNSVQAGSCGLSQVEEDACVVDGGNAISRKKFLRQVKTRSDEGGMLGLKQESLRGWTRRIASRNSAPAAIGRCRSR